MNTQNACFNCGKYGHFAADCRSPAQGNQLQLQATTNNSIGPCYNCGKIGHLAHECRSKQTSNQPEWRRNPQNWRPPQAINYMDHEDTNTGAPAMQQPLEPSRIGQLTRLMNDLTFEETQDFAKSVDPNMQDFPFA